MPGPSDRKMGRPSKYRSEFAAQALKLCRLGMTNEELAEYFEVDAATVKRWMVAHPDFRAALKGGRVGSDARVAGRLYKRAIGYPRVVQKVFREDGETVIAQIIENVLPDVTAQIFWLKNRRPDKWRDKPAEMQAETTPIDDGLSIPGLDEELAG